MVREGCGCGPGQPRVSRETVMSRVQMEFITAVETLGKALKEQGPLDSKAAHLLQLAASIAIHSEKSVHSHVRQAQDNGHKRGVRHAIILLTSTIGFPTVSAALSWAEDILEDSGEVGKFLIG
ncbi:MAG: carboxymuconolactone decarboxylase family protein [Nitrospira sp.]